MNAIDLTRAGDTIVVLAGTPEAKSVSVFVNSVYGGELLRFPVSQYATSIRAVGSDTFALGIGTSVPGTRGAVEYWNVRGQTTGSIPMPAAVIGLSTVSDGLLYALVADGEKRAAVPMHVGGGTTHARVVPLPARVASLDQCPLLGERYLITSDAAKRVQFVNARTARVATTSLTLERASCMNGGRIVAGMQTDAFGRRVTLIELSKEHQTVRQLRAPGDAVAAIPGTDGALLILRRMGTDSNIMIWRRKDLAPK